jgi:transposase
MLKDVGSDLLEEQPKPFKKLGMDEIAWAKGKGNYCAVLVDLETHKPVAILPSRSQESLREVFDTWGFEVLNEIEEVSIDLWKPYKNLIEEMMPNAEVVADRFHVMKLVNDELDEHRKAEKKAAEKIKDKAERERILKGLNCSKYALLKNEEDLNESQKQKLSEVSEVAPDLAKMHQLKEEFRQIFETSKNWAEGTLRLLDWLVKSAKYFKDSCSTIIRWFGEVTAYFECRISNGIVEGINNKLKLIKRSGYGFRNFGNFRLRSLLSWEL